MSDYSYFCGIDLAKNYFTLYGEMNSVYSLGHRFVCLI